MTREAEILAAQLEANPDEDVIWNMLVDELLGAGEPQWEAHDTANYHRRAGRQARTLAQATHLMRGEEPSGLYLRSVIVRSIGRRGFGTAPILVVEGDSGPTPQYHPVWSGTRHRLRVGSVTVGAGWVLNTWAEKQARDARHAAARDRARRS